MPTRLYAALISVAIALAAVPSGAVARTAPITVLVGTDVADSARPSMAPALWSRLISDWVNASTIPFAGEPSLADCMRAKAFYMVWAPFGLTPRLPGTIHVNDRISATTRVRITNCTNGQVAYDQVIALESNPISVSNEGDFEPVSETTWESSVRDTLRRHPLLFEQTAHIVRVDGPFVYVDVPGTSVVVGQRLRVFANASGKLAVPVLLTVLDVTGKLVQTQYDATDPANKISVGDLVEPYTPTKT